MTRVVLCVLVPIIVEQRSEVRFCSASSGSAANCLLRAQVCRIFGDVFSQILPSYTLVSL